MSSNYAIYKDLGNSECAVWSKLTPGIDPAEWAYLCRFLGNLSPREFSDFSSLILISHNRFKSVLKRHVFSLLGLSKRDSSSAPIVSIGPSGIGGEFQKEVVK